MNDYEYLHVFLHMRFQSSFRESGITTAAFSKEISSATVVRFFNI